MKHAVTDRSARRGICRSILLAMVAMSPACGAGGTDTSAALEAATANLVTAPADVCGSADENGQLALSCPEGTVIKAVSFASYGTPGGACGGFTADGCNAPEATTVLSTACMGKASCTLAANNDTFGDP